MESAWDYLYKVFYPYVVQRQEDMRKSKKRFVHYTSAEAVMNILRSREVWMRKSSVMNDFMEIEYGLYCFNNAYRNSAGERFRKVINGLFPSITDEIEKYIKSLEPDFRNGTYLACISEHEDSEDRLGRLSMWRAYGGMNGVAVVFNPSVFLTPSDALKAYTSPVAYFSREEFSSNFHKLVDIIEGSAGLIRSLDQTDVLAYLIQVIRFSILCTKHPGFSEEREWRIIYSPNFQKSERIVKDFVSIRGTPQPIYKIPLKDVPEEGLFNASLPGLIDRIIIGPCRYPAEARETFIELLKGAGVKGAEYKVFVSDIPLRTD